MFKTETFHFSSWYFILCPSRGQTLPSPGYDSTAKNRTSRSPSIDEAIFCIKPFFQKCPAAIKRGLLYIFDLKFSINHMNSRSRSSLEMIRLIINTKRRRAVWKDKWTLIAREISKTHITGHASQIISSEEQFHLVLGGNTISAQGLYLCLHFSLGFCH